MKKLLSLIGAISIAGSGASAVVACGTEEGSNFNFSDFSTYGENQKAEIGNLLAGLISLEMNHTAAQNNAITLSDLQGQGKYVKILDSTIIRAVQNIIGVSLFPNPVNGKETPAISSTTINDYATLTIKAITAGVTPTSELKSGDKLALTIKAKPNNPLSLKNALTVDFTLTDKINLNILPKTIVVDQKPGTATWSPEDVTQGMVEYITNWINNFLPSGDANQFTTSDIASQLNFSNIPKTIANYMTYPVTIKGTSSSKLFANSPVNNNFVIGYSFKPTDDLSPKGVGITLTPPTDPTKFALTDLAQWKSFFTGLPNLVVPTINTWLKNTYSGAATAPKISSNDLRVDFLPLLYQVVKDFTSGAKTFDFTKIQYLTVSFANNSAVNTTELALSLKITWNTPSAKI